MCRTVVVERDIGSSRKAAVMNSGKLLQAKTIPKKQIKAPAPPIKAKYPIMDWKNLPFNTAVWKESERLAGKEGYKHPVRVVYNPKQ